MALTSAYLIEVNRSGPSVPDSVIDGAVAAATALVESYAPDAPDAIKDEAAARCGSYLLEHRGSSIDGRSQGGLLRKSGAQSLLGPWHVRRAQAAT